MESFKDYIEGLKKEKEERLEEDIIDEIADKVFKKLQEKIHPVIPYCLNCPYYHTYTTTWTDPAETYSRFPQTYSIDSTNASKTHTGEGEDE